MYSTLFCWFALRRKPILGNSTVVVVVNMRLKGGAFDIHVVVICLNCINACIYNVTNHRFHACFLTNTEI